MPLIVTGPMGHVGLEVVRQAVARGHQVVAIHRGPLRSEDAKAVSAGTTFVRADLADMAALRAIADSHAIDGVIHPAAVPNENLARPDPLGTVHSNVVATANLLELARLKGWRRVVTVSSGSVFQDATDTSVPVLEDRVPSVTNVYSSTKLCGELVTTMYRTQYALSAATVRISWVYGPPLAPRVRDDPRGPIPWFLKCALSGVPVRDAGGADFLASYTHVSDVAAGLIAAYEAKTLRHPIYHLGSGRNFSTADVVRAIKQAVPGAEIEVGPGTAPWTGHTRMRGPLAGSRLKDDASFVPRLSLEDGIAQFADWMRANRERWQ